MAINSDSFEYQMQCRPMFKRMVLMTTQNRAVLVLWKNRIKKNVNKNHKNEHRIERMAKFSLPFLLWFYFFGSNSFDNKKNRFLFQWLPTKHIYLY